MHVQGEEPLPRRFRRRRPLSACRVRYWFGVAPEMAAAAEELQALLRGEGWPLPEQASCDVAPPQPPEPARLRRNTCYVVLAVLLNQKVGWGGSSPSRWDRLCGLDPGQAEPSLGPPMQPSAPRGSFQRFAAAPTGGGASPPLAPGCLSQEGGGGCVSVPSGRFRGLLMRACPALPSCLRMVGRSCQGTWRVKRPVLGATSGFFLGRRWGALPGRALWSSGQLAIDSWSSQASVWQVGVATATADSQAWEKTGGLCEDHFPQTHGREPGQGWNGAPHPPGEGY